MLKLGEEELQENIIKVYKYFREVQRGWSYATDRTRGNGHKVKHKMFLLSIRKHIFTARMTQHWHTLPMEAVESSFLETCKGHLNKVLGNWLSVVLLDQMTSRGS